MENDERKVVDLYIPRKCSATNRIIGPKDFSSVQLNIVDVDSDGKALHSHQTFCLSGKLRAQGLSDAALNRLCFKKGLLSFAKNMADYVVALSAWLDPHLLLPLLDACSASDDLLQAQAKVVGMTRLFARMESMQQSGVTFPQLSQKASTLEEMQQLQSESADRKALHSLAKLQYDTGDYSSALTSLKELSRQGEKDLWGLLHAAVAALKYDEGTKYLSELSDDCKTSEQRVWLAHLALFLAFPEHPALLLDIAGDEVRGLTSACPHLAKYLVAALLLTQDHDSLTRLLSAIKPENDPLVTLVSRTVVSFDFRGAMELFTTVKSAISSDFFLKKVEEQLGVVIQRFVIETYLRVHSRLSFQELASYIGLSVDETELWAANLIRNARMEATISDQGIQMLRASHSLYSQIIDKTKEAYFRSKILLSNVKAN